MWGHVRSDAIRIIVYFTSTYLPNRTLRRQKSHEYDENGRRLRYEGIIVLNCTLDDQTTHRLTFFNQSPPGLCQVYGQSANPEGSTVAVNATVSLAQQIGATWYTIT